MVFEPLEPPRLRLATRAPFWADQVRPLAIHDHDPLPLLPRTLTGTRVQFGQVPAPPVLLLVLAAAVPATWVPWPCLSSVSVDDLDVKLMPCWVSTLPNKSGWLALIPVSRMAILTSLLP